MKMILPRLKWFGLSFHWGLALLVATAVNLPDSQAAENEGMVWSAVFLQSKFAPESKWGVFLEAQHRTAVSASSINRLLLRSALRYEVTPGIFIYAGHGWTPNFSPYRDEHRLWQGFQAPIGLGGRNFIFRFRQEQRWIENTSELSHRSRLLLKHTFTPFRTSTGLAVWDELFLNWNDVENGSIQGFDQNRIFLGPSLSLGNGASVEVGYMNLVQRRRQADALLGHTLLFNTFLNF